MQEQAKQKPIEFLFLSDQPRSNKSEQKFLFSKHQQSFLLSSASQAVASQTRMSHK
jgi:hypothetical protein